MNGRVSPIQAVFYVCLLAILSRLTDVNTIWLKSVYFNLLMFAQGDAVPNANGPPPNPLIQAVPMLVMFAVLFYLIMIRPQQGEQKERQERLEALKKNDKVLTIGGVIGTIVDFSGDGKRVTLRVDDGTRIKFTRSSIQGLYNESDGENADSKS